METRRLNDWEIYRRLLRQARPLAPLLVGMFFLQLLATPLTLLTPLPLKIAVDNVIGGHPLPAAFAIIAPESITGTPAGMVFFAAALVIVIAMLIQAQGMANWISESYVSEKLVLGFRSRLFRHVQRLSLLYHDKFGTADSLYRIQYDAPAIQWILVHGIAPFVTSVCTLAGMVYIIARIDGQLALIALTVAPILFGMSEVYRRRVRTRWNELKETESSTMTVLEETLGAIRVVKAFGQEDRQHESYVTQAKLGAKRHVYLSFLDGGFGALVATIIAAGTASALYFGVRHVQSGAMTLGQLLLVMAYIAQLYDPMRTISAQIGQMQSSMAGAERAFSLLEELPDVADLPQGQHIARANGAIEFRKVSFEYAADQLTLHEITFQVSPGARVGITGTTGAGKTTLVSLLTRFYDPTAGQILLDGTDVREFRLTDLRNQFAIVLQESVLFSSSIAENIAYARPGASEADIIRAAKAANAHDFIETLPDGYQTLVGQRGGRLSGGERQRISLARAFLKDAPILVLDEPTSSVDTKTEASIMEAMEKLMRGRTTFMIAHRLSTLNNCDMRLHLESGKLVAA